MPREMQNRISQVTIAILVGILWHSGTGSGVARLGCGETALTQLTPRERPSVAGWGNKILVDNSVAWHPERRGFRGCLLGHGQSECGEEW
jgi:hypothetical protein